jgi:hypothetical protein
MATVKNVCLYRFQKVAKAPPRVLRREGTYRYHTSKYLPLGVPRGEVHKAYRGYVWSEPVPAVEAHVAQLFPHDLTLDGGLWKSDVNARWDHNRRRRNWKPRPVALVLGSYLIPARHRKAPYYAPSKLRDPRWGSVLVTLSLPAGLPFDALLFRDYYLPRVDCLPTGFCLVCQMGSAKGTGRPARSTFAVIPNGKVYWVATWSDFGIVTRAMSRPAQHVKGDAHLYVREAKGPEKAAALAALREYLAPMPQSTDPGAWWLQKPSVARDERGVLHSAAGPALVYPGRGGWEAYFWHGVQVDARVVLHPEQLTPADIEAEENAEVRRVKIERYGFERYLRDGGFTCIQQDDFGKLWQKAGTNRLNGVDPALTFLEVVNATPEPDGTYKRYVLPTRNTVRSAHEAVARSFGLELHEYSPEVET